MQRFCLWGLVASGMLVASGCGGANAIIRGQSPAHLQQATAGYSGPIREVSHEHFHGRAITHYSVDSSGGGCPSDGYGCPPGAGHMGCPPGGPGCPPGGHGCHPHHGYTFSYERPNNLVYPPANVPGGAVAYPYYTLKGPSDFFRAH
ncbi:MAG: hypothetical protein KF774_06535 [Planctomyces sp.]|nr:hypothetical protein [Planctomyces sp.]